MSGPKRVVVEEPLEELDPFDLDAQRRDPQEGLVKAQKLLLEVPVVGRPSDLDWFRVHRDLEFPTTLIDAGRKDFYMVAPYLRAALDRFLRPYILNVIMVRPDEIKIWVRRVAVPGEDPNKWWVSAALYAERAKTEWLQMQVGGETYKPYAPEGKFPDPVWPENLTMSELVRKGFGERMINSREHPLFKRLVGLPK